MADKFIKADRFNMRVEGDGFDVRLITKDQVMYTQITKEEAERIYNMLKMQLNK